MCVDATANRRPALRHRDVLRYRFSSPRNAGGPGVLRVLRPAQPAAHAAHNVLIVLPVEEGRGRTYGNGLDTVRALRAHDRYHLTVVEPTFGIEPWYADNPLEAGVRHETFLVHELVPWIRGELPVTGTESIWLIGFSKSGLAAHSLLLKHPDVFALAACWDFPAAMAAYDAFGRGSAACFGTDASFQENHRLTARFVREHKQPFTQNARMWLGRGPIFGPEVAGYESLLSTEGVQFAAGSALDSAHRWDGGWVPAALAALHACGDTVCAT